LTDRERAIVMLIRNGLTDRDVAQRLSLSVRTVENHIYKAMAKTGPPAATSSRTYWPRHRTLCPPAEFGSQGHAAESIWAISAMPSVDRNNHQHRGAAKARMERLLVRPVR
jgi:hypothetical protein